MTRFVGGDENSSMMQSRLFPAEDFQDIASGIEELEPVVIGSHIHWLVVDEPNPRLLQLVVHGRCRGDLKSDRRAHRVRVEFLFSVPTLQEKSSVVSQMKE